MINPRRQRILPLSLKKQGRSAVSAAARPFDAAWGRTGRSDGNLYATAKRSNSANLAQPPIRSTVQIYEAPHVDGILNMVKRDK